MLAQHLKLDYSDRNLLTYRLGKCKCASPIAYRTCTSSIEVDFFKLLARVSNQYRIGWDSPYKSKSYKRTISFNRTIQPNRHNFYEEVGQEEEVVVTSENFFQDILHYYGTPQNGSGSYSEFREKYTQSAAGVFTNDFLLHGGKLMMIPMCLVGLYIKTFGYCASMEISDTLVFQILNISDSGTCI